METLVKQELHKLVDECNNEMLLLEAKNILSGNHTIDWWDELSENDKQLLKESEEEYKVGNYISHNELLQQFEEWKKK